MCTDILNQNEKLALLLDYLQKLYQRYRIQTDYHYDCYKHKQLVVCHINRVSCMQFPIQHVFCYIGWIKGRHSTAVIPVLYYELNLLFPADSKNAFIIDIVIMFQSFMNATVTHVWMLVMDLFYLFSYLLIQEIIFIVSLVLT